MVVLGQTPKITGLQSWSSLASWYEVSKGGLYSEKSKRGTLTVYWGTLTMYWGTLTIYWGMLSIYYSGLWSLKLGWAAARLLLS